MSEPTLDSFFGGGSGGRSVSWKNADIGTTISGTILAVHPPQQQTDPVDGSLQFYKKGPRSGQPKMSVRIDLQTDLRDWKMTKKPDDPNEVDDGTRNLYVQGWMQGSVSEALRKAGRNGPPEVGGKLSVTLSEREPNANAALNPTNKFTATYESPSSTAEFFGGGNGLSSPATQPTSQSPQKPDSIAQAAWDQMPDNVKASVAATMAKDDIPF